MAPTETMKRIFLPALAAILFPAAASGAASPAILPFEEVRAGMTGTGRTVFSGDRVETFEVEILGTLPNIGPGQNLILGVCRGGPLAETRILSGMSGSPVYVGDRLIGAVAYSWGFSKEPIAGITPIEEMLEVAGRRDSPSRRTSSATWTEASRLLLEPAALTRFVEERLPTMAPSSPFPGRTSVPLSIGGLPFDAWERTSEPFRRAGFVPVQTGTTASGAAAPGPLAPGSAVGIQLVRGDVEITATGTVTWKDGDRLLAFGHPLYGLGDVDLPLTAARVEALLPSLAQSVKIAVPTGEVGAFRQDRTAGIFGRVGAKPRMIPVRVQIAGAGRAPRTFSFDVANDPLLAPLLLYSTVNGILSNSERMYGSLTLRLREGSVIRIENQEEVDLANLFAGETAPAYASALPAYLLYLLMNNEWSSASVDGINLLIDYDDAPRSAMVRRVTLDRYRVRAGDRVAATVVVSPYRGPDLIFRREFAIPSETPPGPLLVQVGNALAISRAEAADDPVVPRDLDQLVRLINRLRRNDRVYLLATRTDTGAFVGGARLPNLPPSAVTLFSRPRSQGNLTLLARRGVLEEEILTEYAVTGLARLQLEVEP